MDSSAALRSFHCSVGGSSQALSTLEKSGLTSWPSNIQPHGRAFTTRKLTASIRKAGVVVSCAKTPEATESSESDRKRALCATFPNAFEALLLEVCDESSVAELQLKVGDFEMYLKRNVGATNAPVAVAPPVPSEPMAQSAPVATSASASKSSSDNPFARPLSMVSSRLASLEASGVDGFKLVTSPTVGSFQRGRIVKGKKQPPVCKKGDVIKEGQVIGYIDRFGVLLPIKSDVAGEVLKLLFEDGEAVGYGDPLIAVLPSFYGLN